MARSEKHVTQEVSLRKADGTTVVGRMLGASREHFAEHTRVWRPSLKALHALDGDWDWEADFITVELPAENRETYALVLDETLQALMSVEFRTNEVYVERLAVSPANRGTKATKGCGTGLLLLAMLRSQQSGLGGAISLHSLEDPATVAFYREKMKMVETGIEIVDGQQMRRFELSAQAAQRHLGGDV